MSASNSYLFQVQNLEESQGAPKNIVKSEAKEDEKKLMSIKSRKIETEILNIRQSIQRSAEKRNSLSSLVSSPKSVTSPIPLSAKSSSKASQKFSESLQNFRKVVQWEGTLADLDLAESPQVKVEHPRRELTSTSLIMPLREANYSSIEIFSPLSGSKSPFLPRDRLKPASALIDYKSITAGLKYDAKWQINRMLSPNKGKVETSEGQVKMERSYDPFSRFPLSDQPILSKLGQKWSP